MDDADGVAKRQATRARPEVGSIHGLQTPRVCFIQNTVPVHNLDRLVQAAARRLWFLHTEAQERAVRKSLSVYRAVTECALIHWGGSPPHDGTAGGPGTCGGPPPPPPMPERGDDPTSGHYLLMEASIRFGCAHPVAHAPGRLVRALEAARDIGMGRHSPVWSGYVRPQRGLAARRRSSSQTRGLPIYVDPFGDWEAEDLGYLYDRGLAVGAA